MTIPLSEEERVSPETQREPPIVATAVCDSAMLANSVRALAMDAVQAANSGHPGMPMGMAEIAVALWTRHLRHNPADPHWADRDRFVLSNGHGSMLQYALLHLSGYALPIDEIKHFRQLNSMTPGHPEVGVTPGVETTTGLRSARGDRRYRSLRRVRAGGSAVQTLRLYRRARCRRREAGA